MAIREKGSLATTVVVSRAPDLSGNWVCDGTADDVEINEALAYVNTLGGGRVMLKQGTFTLADPIVIPGNNITLRGMGRSTFIDGDGLATGEHAIVISGVTHCVVKKLAIQTQDGGTKTCHCIFIEDGASQTTIDRVHIVDSDSDGIHIEGTSMFDTHIHNCHIEDVDDHGIYALMDEDHHLQRLCIKDNLILSAGLEGIEIADPTGTGANEYTQIIGNLIYQAGAEGIEVVELTYSLIRGNVILDCGGDGIEVTNTTHLDITDNMVWSCTLDGIEIGGTSTEVLVSANVCCDNGSDGVFAGIDCGTVSGCQVEGNATCSNQRFGIILGVAAGGRNQAIGNFVFENQRDGIYVAGMDCLVEGNFVYGNGQETGGTYHGIAMSNNCIRGSVLNNHVSSDGDDQQDCIHLEDGATHILIRGNYCYNGMGTGIALAANNVDCHIEGNYVYLNDDYGIEVLAGCVRTVVNDNRCIQNGLHGITCGSADCQINDNYIYATGQTGAETYHGIYLDANGDRCQISGNRIADPGDSTEDGIHLADGAVDVLINNNYIYNLMGSGIALTANNLRCLISGNFCTLNDDYGIEITAATCSKNIVKGNQLTGNVTGAISDSGTLTQVYDDNEGIDVIDIKIYRTVKNTSGAQRVAGDVVIIKGIATAIEVTTTTTQGDDKVYGMVAETIDNNASGYVLVKGFTAALKVDGTEDIAIDDPLGTFTTACIAMKAAAGDQAFALALEAYSTDDSNGVLNAYIKSPWD